MNHPCQDCEYLYHYVLCGTWECTLDTCPYEGEEYLWVTDLKEVMNEACNGCC